MKMYGDVEVYFYAFLILVLTGDESAPRSGCFIPWQRTAGTLGQEAV
jgi:hypothetical protein